MFTLLLKNGQKINGYIYHDRTDGHELDERLFSKEEVKGVEWDGSLYTLYVQNIPNLPYQTEAKFFQHKGGYYLINGEVFPESQVIGIVKTKVGKRT